MGSSIVDIKNMGDALRNTGYKNIESAVSEIIDNSIEANAKNIFIILKEHINPLSGRKVMRQLWLCSDNPQGKNKVGTLLCLQPVGKQGKQLHRGRLYGLCRRFGRIYAWCNQRKTVGVSEAFLSI